MCGSDADVILAALTAWMPSTLHVIPPQRSTLLPGGAGGWKDTIISPTVLSVFSQISELGRRFRYNSCTG